MVLGFEGARWFRAPGFKVVVFRVSVLSVQVCTLRVWGPVFSQSSELLQAPAESKQAPQWHWRKPCLFASSCAVTVELAHDRRFKP